MNLHLLSILSYSSINHFFNISDVCFPERFKNFWKSLPKLIDENI